MSKKRKKSFKTLSALYKELISSRYKDQNFWILTAFVPTFAITRLVVHLYPNTYLLVGGHHLHHFIYGFLLLAVSGYAAINRPNRAPAWIAAVFGAGLALAIDESGMWVLLTNHYYNETSEDIIVLTLALLINLVYFREFWLAIIRAVGKQIKRLFTYY